MPDRARPAADGWAWALGVFLICLGVASLPLLVTDTPPLFDYPNHLARADAISRFGQDPLLRAHFTLSNLLIPNVLSDLALLAAMQVFEPRTAGRLLLFLTFALTLGGLAALNRAVAGRWSPWPLLGAVFLTNEMFFWGFLNYNLGIALLPWALAAWIVLDGGPAWRRVGTGALFGIAIFLAHLVAFGLFAVGIGVLELIRAWKHRRDSFGAVSGRLLASASQFVPALVLYWGLSPSRGLPLDIRTNYDAWSKWAPYSRVLSSGNPEMDTPVLLAAVGVAIAGLATGRAILSVRLTAVALAFAVLVYVLPYAALGSFFLDSRIVIAVAFMLIAALVPRRMGLVGAALVGLAVVGLLSWRTTVIANDWRAQSAALDEALAAFEKLPEGALLVAASGRFFELGDWVTTRWTKPAHEHTATYAMIDRHAVVPSLFAKPGQNPLEYRPATEALQAVARNPIMRVMREEDFRILAAEAGAVAFENRTAEPAFAGVFAVVFHQACDEWPTYLETRPVACGGDFSLVEIPPKAPGKRGAGSLATAP